MQYTIHYLYTYNNDDINYQLDTYALRGHELTLMPLLGSTLISLYLR